MRRVLFFSLLVACGPSEPQAQHVEVAQPLPTVSDTATAPPPPTATAAVIARADVDDARDLRRTTQRSRSLLVTETQALENLLATVAGNAPDRPALLRRLAENYVDLRKSGVPDAGAKAIQRYADLVTSYPSYAQIDEAYYYLALEYEIAGDLTNARRNYYELIKRAPSSKYVPYAYYAFGEIFFREAKSDPSKFDLAKQAYTEVLKFSGGLANNAACRLAQVYDAQGDASAAARMRARGGTCGG